MQNTLILDGEHLIVEPRGLDKLWGLRRRIVVPLAQVRGATFDPDTPQAGRGLRFPGLALPGRKWVGTFYEDGEKGYWNVRAGGQTIVVELGAGAPFSRLHLTVDDGRAMVDIINAPVSPTDQATDGPSRDVVPEAAVMRGVSTAVVRIVVLGAVIALYYAVVSASGWVGGADAGIGAVLAGFAGLAVLSFGWAFVDGRSGRLRHVLVSWSLVAAIVALGWRITVSVVEADSSLSPAEVFVADLSLGLFVLGLVLVPASAGAVAGAALRRDMT